MRGKKVELMLLVMYFSLSSIYCYLGFLVIMRLAMWLSFKNMAYLIYNLELSLAFMQFYATITRTLQQSKHTSSMQIYKACGANNTPCVPFK